jgi:hypothetical protein
VVKLVAIVWKRSGSGEFLSRVRADPITFFRTRRTSEGINLVKLGALAAGAIRHRLVEFSAKGAVPKRSEQQKGSPCSQSEGYSLSLVCSVMFPSRLFRSIKRTSRTRWMHRLKNPVTFDPSVFVDRGGL